jgi:hypothetical protein
MSPKTSLSPKEFLRRRRPERFSDTRSAAGPLLDRTTLEYQLETLTSRSQETDFQNFAFKLAQRVICPNLRPQTGPTGGGDSKADAETFPVADQAALAWFIGTDGDANSERWAFAFSTKKKWQEKAASDIKKISETERGYKRAFFVTSQFTRDKKRAEMEDALTKECGLVVTILDRNWILDQIFSRNLEDMAIAELRMSVPPRPISEVGPHDTRRRRELAEAEKQIETVLGSPAPGSQVVWYAIEAARLCRELEHPRAEIDGRHLRAIELGKRYGTDRQIAESVYQYAWTTFWWHEDFATFNRLYSDVEALAKDSDNVAVVKLLSNLWHLLFMLEKQGNLTRDELEWNARMDVLAKSLHRVSQAEHIPSAALDARAMLLLQRASATFPNVSSSIFVELKEILAQSEGLLGFPVQQLTDVIMELGQLVHDNPEYEDLYESILPLLQKREGEIASARAALRRSMQKLESGRYYDAIALAGKALTPLWRNETQSELLAALYVCAQAYEEIGLLWAARGALLNAASVVVNRFHEDNRPEVLRIGCFSRLKWLEVLLGRVPHALAWYKAEEAVRSFKEEKVDPTSEEFVQFDAVLGMMFLKVDLRQLRSLERLPDVLTALGLQAASTALLYALGWTDDVAAEVGIESPAELENFFVKWRGQPAGKDLPAQIELNDADRLSFASSILGCRIEVAADNNPSCEALAESFLAAFESALATAYRQQIVPLHPSIEVEISSTSGTAFPFAFEVTEAPLRLQVHVACASFDPHKLAMEEHQVLKKKLFELIATLVAHCFPVDDFQERFTKLFGAEGAFDRALGFTGSFVTLGNVLGKIPPTRIDAWVVDNGRTFQPTRSKCWDAELPPPQFTDKQKADTETTSRPDRQRSEDDLNHRNVVNLSVIDPRLWDKAEWKGAAFLHHPTGEEPSILALAFKDIEAAGQIFSEWSRQLGKRDEKDTLRVTIVRGFLKSNPAAYRVVVGSNPEASQESEGTFFILSNRSRTMEPRTSENLVEFLKKNLRFGYYFFGYAKLVESASGQPGWEPQFDHLIGKQKLYVREAWTIGRNDPDAMGIQPDDDPILPTDNPNPPVVELMDWLRKKG